MNNFIVGINLAYVKVISVILPVADRLFQFSPTDDLEDLFDTLTEEAGTANNIYEQCVQAINAIWYILIWPFVGNPYDVSGSPHLGTEAVWHGVNGGWLASTLMDFCVMLAIFVFFWGLTKANIHFDRHDSWKHLLGRVLQLVIVIILINQTFNIVTWLQDVASAFYTEITARYGAASNDLVNGLETAIFLGDYAVSDLNEGALTFLGKIVAFFASVTVSVGIVKKVIDIIKQCVPTIVELYVYTWAFPIGISWLAAPEGKQRFSGFISGYLQALFTNIMRILSIVFLGVIAGARVTLPAVGTAAPTTLSFFNVAEIVWHFVIAGSDDGNGNPFVRFVLYSQHYGIDILFALGVLELLMRGSEKLAARITG